MQEQETSSGQTSSNEVRSFKYIINFIITACTVYYPPEDYRIVIVFINANLRAKHVYVARPEGRQKSSLPGCSPCAFM